MTPGNGNAHSSQHNGHRKPAQALVKSHILTHLIEGFVIQEGAKPFPVERPSFSIDSLKRHSGDGEMDGLSARALKVQQEPMLTCELCGKVDFAYIFKRSKRFCSTVCAKRYNVGCTKRVGLFPNRKTTLENERKQRMMNGNMKSYLIGCKKKSLAPLSTSDSGHLTLTKSSNCSDLSGSQKAQDPAAAAPQMPVVQGHELQALPYSFLPSDPGQWNIEDVYEFISALPGCLEIAEEFRSQEIDGQALLLLKEDHLMATMNIKLGPALKIFAQINSLKDS
eukprot:XP_003962949.1 PREDICTED: polyhomeotic-like protein 2 [Takifugu rubripes]